MDFDLTLLVFFVGEQMVLRLTHPHLLRYITRLCMFYNVKQSLDFECWEFDLHMHAC